MPKPAGNIMKALPKLLKALDRTFQDEYTDTELKYELMKITGWTESVCMAWVSRLHHMKFIKPTNQAGNIYKITKKLREYCRR